jgi:hypothetical protein
MVVLSKLRAANATVDRWFRDHVVVWWTVLAVVPGGAYAGAELLLTDGSAFRAILLGGVFGVVFATLTVGVQRWQSS